MKRLDDALLWYDRCLSVKPHCATTHALRGFTLHLQGCFDEAIDTYHRALTLQPSNIFCTDMLTKALNDITNFNSNVRVVRERHIGDDDVNSMDLPPPRPPPSSHLNMSSSMHMQDDDYGAGRGVGAGGEVFSPPPPPNDNNDSRQHIMIMSMRSTSTPPPPPMEGTRDTSYSHPHAQGEHNYSFSRISHAGLDIDGWTGGSGSRPPSAPPSAPASGTRSRIISGSVGSASSGRDRSSIGSASRSGGMIDYRSQHYFGHLDDSNGIITAQNESGQDDSGSSISYTRIANRLSLDSSDASSRIV